MSHRPFGAATVFVDPTVGLVDLSGLLDGTWTNPVLLGTLGIPDFPGQGEGSIGVTRQRNPATGSLDTAVGLTLLFDGRAATTPEPEAIFFLGVGLLAIAMRLFRVTRGKRT